MSSTFSSFLRLCATTTALSKQIETEILSLEIPFFDPLRDESFKNNFASNHLNLPSLARADSLLQHASSSRPTTTTPRSSSPSSSDVEQDRPERLSYCDRSSGCLCSTGLRRVGRRRGDPSTVTAGQSTLPPPSPSPSSLCLSLFSSARSLFSLKMCDKIRAQADFSFSFLLFFVLVCNRNGNPNSSPPASPTLNLLHPSSTNSSSTSPSSSSSTTRCMSPSLLRTSTDTSIRRNSSSSNEEDREEEERTQEVRPRRRRLSSKGSGTGD